MAVDVTGYSVQFFKEHVYVSRKRRYREIGDRHESSYHEVVDADVGKRPNLIRIYDKIAQREAKDAHSGNLTLA